MLAIKKRKKYLRFFAFILLGILVVGAVSFKHTPVIKHPNIIVILVDDAGYADFGFMGSKDLKTPNLDLLASSSAIFSDAHVSATVCSPSRAGLLTGKYQQRFGYECNEGEGYTGMDTAQVMLPKYLKANGYKTAAIGKWHVGFNPDQHPLAKGFDYYYGFLSGGRSYFYQPNKDDRSGSKNALIENKTQVSFEGYLTDVLGDKAVTFIQENKHQPFFMYWAPNAVHTPMEASDADLQQFVNHPRQKLAAMTFALDRAVGNIINELKRQELFDNTLIFFLSDNGGAHNNLSSNFPLKGFKGNKYEAGHRIPFLVSWPNQFKHQQYKGLTSSLDIFPTALAAAGVNIPSNNNLDGVSLIPFLKGQIKASPHQQLVWRKDAEAAIRFDQYKLIRVNGLGERLYNLKEDPYEIKDLRNAQPQVYAKLKKQLAIWEKDKMKPLWTEGAVWDTITLMIHDDLMNNRPVRVHEPKELESFRSKKSIK